MIKFVLISKSLKNAEYYAPPMTLIFTISPYCTFINYKKSKIRNENNRIK